MRNLGVTKPLAKLLVFAAVSALAWPVALTSQTGRETESAGASRWDSSKRGAPLLRDPIWVYNDWSVYDELSDNIPLTEDLAMRELNEIARLREYGVHFDYYVMDAFWLAKDVAYRTCSRPNRPNGPDHWIAECNRNGILLGLWFGTNEL
jgi:hypothetical protein